MNMDGNELKAKRIAKGLTQTQLCELTGIPQGTLGRIEASGAPIKKVDMLLKLNKIFNNEEYDKNIAHSEDHNSKGKYNRPRMEAVPISLHPHEDDDETGTAKFIYAPDGTMGMRVPIVPAKAQAGYLLGYADPEYYDDFDYEIMPVEKEHKGTYLGFEVRGDSMMTTNPELMENNIYPGWRAIGRDLPRQKWAYKLHTHNYDNWIIVHKTKGILIKTIVKHDVNGGIITIHSLNPDYEDEELHLDDIEQIFSVIQIIPKKKR